MWSRLAETNIEGSGRSYHGFNYPLLRQHEQYSSSSKTYISCSNQAHRGALSFHLIMCIGWLEMSICNTSVRIYKRPTSSRKPWEPTSYDSSRWTWVFLLQPSRAWCWERNDQSTRRGVWWNTQLWCSENNVQRFNVETLKRVKTTENKASLYSGYITTRSEYNHLSTQSVHNLEGLLAYVVLITLWHR